MVAIDRYTRMGDALKNSGREILFSLCEWGGRAPHLWGREAGGQMWRVTGDVVDAWSKEGITWGGLTVNDAIDYAAYIGDYAGPGGWNDMDMLVVGVRGAGHTAKEGCNDEEYRTQFGIWSLVASPLMAGCDIRTMDKATAEIMLNKFVLEVNQDSLGIQGKRVARKGGLEVWRKPMADGSLAVALLNRGDSEEEIELRWCDVGLLDTQKVVVRDLWSKLDVAEAEGKYSRRVPPHATEMLRLFVQ